MAQWSGAPVSLRAYVALELASVLVTLALYVAGGGNPLVLTTVWLPALVCFFLINGVRWLWQAWIVLTALILLTAPFLGGTWYGIGFEAASLVLLLLPDTRRHFASPSTSAS
jgi:hypothetical protein